MSFQVNYQAGGRFDAPYYPTKPSPYIKGRRVPITSSIVEDEYVLEQDMELLTVAVGASRYYDKDHWSLYVDDQLIFDSIYTKDVPEGFYFMVVREVLAGSTIKFRYNNDSNTSKVIWLNYQFLRD